jgi:chromosome segregation ATPase
MSTSMTLMEKTMSGADALQLIEQQVIPLLQIARENIATYTSSPERLQRLKQQFHELESYVKSWFESPSQTSDAIHEPRREIGQESREVVLQRKVEELENIIQFKDKEYASNEQDRQMTRNTYYMVADQKNELEKEKKALAAVNRNLLSTQANNNAEILRLRGEVESLNLEVERLTRENKSLRKDSSKSSSGWSFFGNRSNMQTLLEDLNHFRE